MEEIKKWFESKRVESKERAEQFIEVPEAENCVLPAFRSDELDFVVSHKIAETLKTIVIPSCLTIAVYNLRKFYPFKGLYREQRRFGFACAFVGCFYGANHFYQNELRKNDFNLRELEEGLLRFNLGKLSILSFLSKSSEFRVSTGREATLEELTNLYSNYYSDDITYRSDLDKFRSAIWSHYTWINQYSEGSLRRYVLTELVEKVRRHEEVNLYAQDVLVWLYVWLLLVLVAIKGPS